MTCNAYVADPSFQLQTGGVTGGSDCTAHAMSDLIDSATCGAKDPGGRTIRLQSDEPIPDPQSPGLNLVQVARVAQDHYGVRTEVRIGYNSIPWADYEKRRLAGQPTIIQVRYAAIADSKYDAGRGFRANHALAETTHATYDPLADGRAPGVFRFNGTVYTRSVIQTAAARLDIGGGAHPRPGTVWAAFGPDVTGVTPAYRVSIHPIPPASSRAYTRFAVSAGRITGASRVSTGGFSADCHPPQAIRDTDGSYRMLVQLTSGAHSGTWVASGWAHRV